MTRPSADACVIDKRIQKKNNQKHKNKTNLNKPTSNSKAVGSVVVFYSVKHENNEADKRKIKIDIH